MNETSYERLRNSAVDHGLRFKENRTGDAMMQCPVHTPDNTPSVHVTYKPGKGVTLLHDMHDDNATGDILRELGMSESALYDTPKQAIRHDSRRNRDIEESVRALARVREQEAALAASWKPAGPYTMPQCVPYDDATLTKPMTDLWEALGMPLVGGTSTCPICNAGTLHMAPIHAPNGEYATGVLLSCTSCAPKALYDHLAQNLRITTTRMSISDTHVFITDTTHGFTFAYEDGLTVHRTGDGQGGKRISQSGTTGGKHVPYLLTPSTEHAKHTGVIFITEGEKDAAAMLTAGYAAISTTGGGGNVANTLNIDATVQALAGLNVVAICDKDTTGDKWRQALYDLLTPHVNDHGLQSLTFIQACEPCHDAGDAVALGRFEFERVQLEADPRQDVAEETDDDDQVPFVDTDDFWEQTPYLQAICKAARACRVAPTAVLGIVLARVSVMLPPQVVTPAYVGGRKGSMNLFVAVLGASGDGKGTAASVAARLVPYLFGARTEKPSSGESLAALYAQWASEENPQDAKHPITYLACANPRALIDIPEVTWLGSVAVRKGSTLGGELASAFVGERLGGATKDQAKTITAPEDGYRMALITGVQYANADALFDMSGTGVPQRFLWVDTLDNNMPETAPAYYEGLLAPLVDRGSVPDPPENLQALYRAGSIANMLNGERAWGFIEMCYPPEVRERTDRLRYERNLAKKRKEDKGDNLEGHLNFVRIRVAGLLSWLDGAREDHTQVTSEDWRIAGQIIEYSCHVRDKCRERYLQTVRDNRAEYETVRKGAQDDAERNLAMIRQETPGKVVAFLSKRGRKGKPFKGTDIARNISRKWRPYVYAALDELCEQGMVQRVEDTGASTTSTWAIFK